MRSRAEADEESSLLADIQGQLIRPQYTVKVDVKLLILDKLHDKATRLLSH